MTKKDQEHVPPILVAAVQHRGLEVIVSRGRWAVIAPDGYVMGIGIGEVRTAQDWIDIAMHSAHATLEASVAADSARHDLP